MKFTERDKKLLIILGIVILLVVFIKFLLLPKLNNITLLNADIDTLNNTYAMNMLYKAKAESIDSDIKILSEKLQDLRTIYPPSINGDELLIVIRDIIKESKIDVNAIVFERAKPINLQSNEVAATANTSNAQIEQQTTSATDAGNPLQANSSGSNIMNYFYLLGLLSQQADSSTEEIVIPDGKGYSISVKIDAEGTNEQLKAFFSSLSKLKNRAFCKTSSITGLSSGQSKDSNQVLKFSAEIAFYGIMDKGAGEYYMLPNGKWMPIAAVGKTDVFKEYSSYEFSGSSKSGYTHETGSSTAQNESNENILDLSIYDFSVVTSAFGGGLAPSVAIICNNPVERSIYSNPVVYGDNRGIENTEIFIEEKAGKYYCKFKTNHESYPDKQYNQTFEFVPLGKDLKLIILSSTRSSEEDKAGINLNIINNTKKNLIYSVKFEDATAPRIKIGKTVGSVNHE